MTATADHEPERVWLPASERLLEWDNGFHDLMLGDTLRMNAFRAAIAEAVRPGARVLDLGTGTGILARWALEAGARHVYGIDLNEHVLRTATGRLTAAGFGGDRFLPLHGLSFDIELPEPVDVVIAEIIGNLADNENIVAILHDAHRRFLAPGGVMMPRHVESYLVPVAAKRAHDQLSGHGPHDAAGPSAFAKLLRDRNTPSRYDLYYDAVIPISRHLAAPRIVRRHELQEPAGEPQLSYRVPLVYTARCDGLLTGFKGYFVATLSDTVALDISGDDIASRTASDSWKHCYLPIAEPVPIRQGDRILLTFGRSLPDGADLTFAQSYQWSGRVIRGERTVARFAHSTGSPHLPAPA
ncbi:methyltransferase domain-containing protein [Streptosporangium sp. NPDC001559]|uniref:methyltransferase domain-containing protein n=1 Tax=Streptosporangium sp. NPDC001559 TaxID=3366187 RepID=UPI0036DFC3AB